MQPDGGRGDGGQRVAADRGQRAVVGQPVTDHRGQLGGQHLGCSVGSRGGCRGRGTRTGQQRLRGRGLGVDPVQRHRPHGRHPPLIALLPWPHRPARPARTAPGPGRAAGPGSRPGRPGSAPGRRRPPPTPTADPPAAPPARPAVASSVAPVRRRRNATDSVAGAARRAAAGRPALPHAGQREVTSTCPPAARGQQPGELVGLLGVVVDQQPAVPPAQHGRTTRVTVSRPGRPAAGTPSRPASAASAAAAAVGCSAGTHQIRS